jgi:hypothetical protein
MSYNETLYERIFDMTEIMNKGNEKLRQLAADNPIGYVVVTAALGFLVVRVLHKVCD